MAHGTHDAHAEVIRWVREAIEVTGKPMAILADLAGPKIRIGALAEPIRLGDKSRVVLAPEGEVRENEIPHTYAPLARDVVHGDRILLDDGLMELRVDSVDATRVFCRVVRGGLLKEHKGMNLPGVRVSAPSLTEKDIVDLEFALAQDV